MFSLSSDNPERSLKAVDGSGIFRNGCMDYLQSRGETDDLLNTPSFRGVWLSLFRPSLRLRETLVESFTAMQLWPREFSAAQCRLKHPALMGEILLNSQGQDVDVGGFDFAKVKETIVPHALRAIQCSQKMAGDPKVTLYLYSDVADVVEYLMNQTTVDAATETEIDRAAINVVHEVRLVRRPTVWATANLDRNLGLPVESYLGAFADLYTAVAARCVSYGVGNYGHLAARLSGTNCSLVHTESVKGWGRKYGEEVGRAEVCEL